MVSANQNSHQGHQVGLPKKQTLRLILACKSLLKSATGNNIVEEKGRKQHLAEGEVKLLQRSKDNTNRPPRGGLQPSITVLYWDEKAGICTL